MNEKWEPVKVPIFDKCLLFYGEKGLLISMLA